MPGQCQELASYDSAIVGQARGNNERRSLGTFEELEILPKDQVTLNLHSLPRGVGRVG